MNQQMDDTRQAPLFLICAVTMKHILKTRVMQKFPFQALQTLKRVADLLKKKKVQCSYAIYLARIDS